jgi:hypothetical protein
MAYTQTEAALLNINYGMLKCILRLQTITQSIIPKDDRDSLLHVYELTQEINKVVSIFEQLTSDQT